MFHPQSTLIRGADYYLVSSPFEPFPPNLKAVRLFVSRLRGRAVRRASHDSMSLGRFLFGHQQITCGQPPPAVPRSETPLSTSRPSNPVAFRPTWQTRTT